MDGLLIDSERVIMHAWIAAAGEHGLALSQDDYVAVIGRTEAESRELLTSLLRGDAAYRAISGRATRIVEEATRRSSFPLKDGAAELLRALQDEGIRCGVASSSSTPEIRQRLGRVGVLGRFAALAGGDEVPRGKPDPAVYGLAAARLGILPHDCMVFEDSENGALAALAAGAQVVVVPDLVRLPESITARSVRVLGTLREAVDQIPAWFSAHGFS